MSAGLQDKLSPGAMHACRIAAVLPQQGDQQLFASVFASGTSVYWHSAQAAGCISGRVGKEGVVIPARAAGTPAQRLGELRHAGEVQSLAVRQLEEGRLMLATVDAYGRGTLSRIAIEQQQAAPTSALADAAAADGGEPLLLQPAAGARVEEGGWAGVAFSRAGPLALAAARGFARDVAVYEGAARVRTLRASAQPYAIEFLPAGLAGGGAAALALAETHVVRAPGPASGPALGLRASRRRGGAVSIWDVRAGERGGCVQRVAAAAPGSPLYALGWCEAQGGLLGAAGAERAVQMIDPRRWRCTDKWTGATRQAVHHISFLESNPLYVCASGLDSEVVCGSWGKPPPPVAVRPYGTAAVHAAATAAAAEAPAAAAAAPRPPAADDEDGPRAGGGAFSFRGDARWLGVTKAAGADVLAGLSASGAVVYAQIARGAAAGQPEGPGAAAGQAG
ncbi:hypothetical protein MNEG_9338 [Monoraphidium neglectum]|uniref:Uncharacterized protein n=1 Tax=Monoraphidium neglectum TaxID=145388 RepID=A0A0D2MWK0_9CHLO|nr:hypothetical protein MNEG_9338 [Monoraphidium neglectum]KIY98625.1 hypothetical protein MNEG_9338 [Monoraphidium neglectum]|eukprot:XP_013897645.1 hypothetical protein MNEG_9338 [Monoraphidium neglectum]